MNAVEVGGGFALIPCLFMFVFGTIGLAAFVFWIWMLVDCITKEPSEGNEKIIWILLLIFLPGIGAILYFLVRRPARIRETGQ